MTPYEDEPRYGDEPALLDSRPRRGHPLLAWAVIVAVTAGLVLLQLYKPPPEKNEKKDAQKAGMEPGELLAKIYMGFAEMSAESRAALAEKIDEQLAEQFRDRPTLSMRDRMRLVVVLGELSKPKKAQTTDEMLEVLREMATPASGMTFEKMN